MSVIAQNEKYGDSDHYCLIKDVVKRRALYLAMTTMRRRRTLYK